MTILHPAETSETAPSPLTIAHVPAVRRGYPGDPVPLYTQVVAHTPLTDLTVRVTIPPQLIPGQATAPDSPGLPIPAIESHPGGHDVIWTLAGQIAAGERYEFILETTVSPTRQDQSLVSRATASAQTQIGQPVTVDEEGMVMVYARGAYLTYLPAVFEQDALMGRFLMLFESFWGPIEGQIDALACYFDPRLTPPDFLPWLASWMQLTLDERWSEAQRRLLLDSVAFLYHKRGTRLGLQRYLEIYTGRRAEIIEHRANNFRLGREARLGVGIALGRRNIPHTFTVSLRLPPIEAPTPAERRRLEAERRTTIERIIEMEKPAHTRYSLQLETEA